MADYSVLTGYDDSGVPQYDTITIPDTVTPPEQPAPGGGKGELENCTAKRETIRVNSEAKQP